MQCAWYPSQLMDTTPGLTESTVKIKYPSQVTIFISKNVLNLLQFLGTCLENKNDREQQPPVFCLRKTRKEKKMKEEKNPGDWEWETVPKQKGSKGW